MRTLLPGNDANRDDSANMPSISLRPSHKAVAAYYESLAAFASIGATHELAVKSAFATLIEVAAKPFGWKLVPEHSMRAKGGKRIQPDGTLMDVFRLHHGHWEAKDSSDDLTKEIRAKIDKGYPLTNILFWEPRRAVLYQHGERVDDQPLDTPERLLAILGRFLEFAPQAIAEWEAAVAHFKDIIPTLGKALAAILKKARKENPKYEAAFKEFVITCRGSLNPNLAEAAVEEMLVQHLLTERILRKIFDIEDFRQRNVIAADIEKVIATLTAKHFSRDDFLKALDPFYKAIETAAETFTDFTEKQKFLNIVYERFFQGFAVKQADVLGVVYTPQPLVQFMSRLGFFHRNQPKFSEQPVEQRLLVVERCTPHLGEQMNAVGVWQRCVLQAFIAVRADGTCRSGQGVFAAIDKRPIGQRWLLCEPA